MASVLKAQKANESKRKGKRKADDLDISMEVDVDGKGGEGKAVKKAKRNKQRVLLLSSRGITHRMRHLMNDLEALLPHVKKGVYGTFLSRGRLVVLMVVFNSFPSYRLETRLQEPALPPPRTRRPSQLQQHPLLRSPQARGPLPLGRQNAQWSEREDARPERAHDGRAEDDGELFEGE